MARTSLETLTEPMFYILYALSRKNMCGVEISAFTERLTEGRVVMGPGTMYTILSKFQKEKLIQQVDIEGRRITYLLTDKGREIFDKEVDRLRQCLDDIKRGDNYEKQDI